MTDHIQLQDLATPVSQPRSRLSRSRSTSPRELEGGDVATAATETVAGAATAASAQIDQESSSLTPWRLSFFIRWVTGITSLVTHVPTALFLTAAYLTAWPSFVAQRDTQWDFTLAKWTAKKEFLEWCRLQDPSRLGEECIDAMKAGLPAPPIFKDSDFEERKRQLLSSWFAQASYGLGNFVLKCALVGSAMIWLALLLKMGLGRLHLSISRVIAARKKPANISLPPQNHRKGNVTVERNTVSLGGTSHATSQTADSSGRGTLATKLLNHNYVYNPSVPEPRFHHDVERNATLYTPIVATGQGSRADSESANHSRPVPYKANSGPNVRWWIPADGIRRDVIQADIQSHLGPEAVVRPGEGVDQDKGRNGFWITAYQTLTPETIRVLKADSANFERSGDTGRYENSMVHRSRVNRDSATSSAESQPDHGHSRPSGAHPNPYPLYQHTSSTYGVSSGNQPYAEHPQMRRTQQSQTAATQKAPPGYYLASDGKYYPESLKPSL